MDRHAVVERMLELVAGRALPGAESVEVRLADEEVLRDASGGRVGARAAPGEEADHGAGVVPLEVGQQRQLGGAAGPPGERRRHEIAVVGHVADRAAAVASQRHQAVQPLALGVERAGQIRLDLLAIVAAEADADLARRVGLRSLADQVDDAAAGPLAVQHARGPAQDLDAFERVRIGPRVVVEPHRVEQAIQVLRGLGAADLDPVAAIVRAERIGGAHARGVAGGLLDRLRALQRDAILGDDGKRLRRVEHGRVGLGGGGGAPGDEAVDRAGGALLDRGAADGYAGQLRHRRGLLGEDDTGQAQRQPERDADGGSREGKDKAVGHRVSVDGQQCE